MVVYVVVGVIAFMSGAGGIVWAVCMFMKRYGNVGYVKDFFFTDYY